MSFKVLILGKGIIGSQVNQAALLQGYDVASVDLKDADYTVDLRNHNEYMDVLNEFRPNVIFNTAGKDQKLNDGAKELHNMDYNEWQELFGHNTDLLFNVAQTSLEYFVKSNISNKRLIFTPSTYSFASPEPNFYDNNFVKSFAYVGSQSVYVHLVKYIAKHYADKGIMCNALVPHLVMNEHKDIDTSFSPMGRSCKPNELLPALKMLIDKDNTYMTGEFIKINGGWLC